MKIYDLFPDADLLLEELALNPASSDCVQENRSDDTAVGEVTT